MKISEISERCNLSVDTLRYYERIGLVPPVTRNGGGIREYSEVDVKRIEFIKCMRNVGLPLEVLIEYFDLVQQGDATIEARKQILIQQRKLAIARIEAMNETLKILDNKIDLYEQAVSDAAGALKLAQHAPV